MTRRDWDDDYAARFRPGEIIQAYDRSPRHHGKPIALIRIVSVRKESNREAPISDWEAEGFAWFCAHPDRLPKRDRVGYLNTIQPESFDLFRRSPGAMWVCRFELVEVL